MSLPNFWSDCRRFFCS